MRFVSLSTIRMRNGVSGKNKQPVQPPWREA